MEGRALSLEQTMQPHIAERLKTAIAHQRIAHAYIFHGPRGTGRMQMAIELVKAINCREIQHDACDACPTCRTIANGNHPDVAILSPEGAFIKMEQIRELKSRFLYSAPEGFTRVVILEEAEKMRSEAANSLLKFLEEPSSPMLAILITENAHAILPTIRSRCQIVRFMELPPEKKKQKWLENGAPEPLANILAHLSYEWDPDTEDFERLVQTAEKAIQWGEQILVGTPHSLLAATEDWTKESQEAKHAAFILDTLLLWLRDLLHEQIGTGLQIFTHKKERIARVAQKHPRSQIMLAMDNVLIARRLLSKQQLNRQGILEQLVLAIQDHRLMAENEWQLIVI